MIVFSTTLIYLFKFFTGHWQKPLCGRISDGWRKRRKWKLKIAFIFPHPPILPVFFSFLTASSYDRGLQISIMLKIILRTTHTIFDELLNRSQNKTTCYYIQQKLKNEMKNLMSTLKKKQRKELPRYTKNLSFFIWWFFRLL